ncbi:MAG TPA: response regulator [bacterium]|nr:response regulator [bacterium]HQO35050.1 response regulator [bacterium]HQP97857.1 response regulator [bacterium]
MTHPPSDSFSDVLLPSGEERNEGTILIVDDERVICDLLVEILSENHHYELLSAGDGETALQICSDRDVDLVFTDLRMPGMGGLRLLAELKKLVPETPVVIITGYGSKEDVIQALRLGASNFLLKPNDVENVASIAEKILSMRQRERLGEELFQFFEEEQQSFILPSSLRYALPLIDFLTARLVVLGICTHAELKNIRLALDEALVNAVVHGNLEISSEMKGTTLTDLVRYDEEVRNRSTMTPFCSRKVIVKSRIDRKRAKYTVQDEGKGFDHRSLPNDFSNVDNLVSHGRGLLLIKTFMDEVTFNDSGNAITMIKNARTGTKRSA